MFAKNKLKHEHALELLRQLQRCREFRAETIEHPRLEDKQRMLAAWQAARLSRTYADLRSNPRYRPAVDFFLEELYGPKDFSQRDHDLDRVAPLMVKLLPDHGIQTLALAAEMDALTQELDARLFQVLFGDLGVDGEITEQAYVKAYRRSDNHPRRKRQIELSHTLGLELEQAVKNPLIHGALRVARGPAHVAGLGELQGFLERGFSAFRAMGDATDFLDTILRRETRILDRIYGGEERPFDMDAEPTNARPR